MWDQFYIRIEPCASFKANTTFDQFAAWKCENIGFMNICNKDPFFNCGHQWQETRADEKIPSKYEEIYDKEGQEERFGMVGSSISWGYDEKMHHCIKSVQG